ncbi:hypothetical protein MAR_010750, partial [Mya arenaria]
LNGFIHPIDLYPSLTFMEREKNVFVNRHYIWLLEILPNSGCVQTFLTNVLTWPKEVNFVADCELALTKAVHIKLINTSVFHCWNYVK